MKQGLVRLLYNFGKRFMGWTLHMIMCVLLCYPVSIRIYYQQGVLFLVYYLLIYLPQVVHQWSTNYISSTGPRMGTQWATGGKYMYLIFGEG